MTEQRLRGPEGPVPSSAERAAPPQDHPTKLTPRRGSGQLAGGPAPCCFEVIPAIDLKGGRCVRLVQGRLDAETVYGDDPVAVARRWVAAGAPRLHVVDLDGAVAGRPVAHDLVVAIIRAAGSVPVQVGGGIRRREELDTYLAAGVDRVVLGTAALEDRRLVAEAAAAHPGRVWVGLDARDGRLAVRGWLETTAADPVEAAHALAALAVGGFVVTDIGRDGTLVGPNLARLLEVARAVDRPVLASGGIASAGDIRRLAGAAGGRLAGAIVGRALYAGTLDLADALAAAADARAAAAGRTCGPGALSPVGEAPGSAAAQAPSQSPSRCAGERALPARRDGGREEGC